MKDAKDAQNIIIIIHSIILVIKQYALGKGTFTYQLICELIAYLFQCKLSHY